MELNSRKLIILGVIIVVMLIIIWPSGGTRIKHIEDGSTVVLSNGVKICLLGVTPTRDSKETLQEEYLNRDVQVIYDSESPFNIRSAKSGRKYYAYLRVKNQRRGSINGNLIKDGHTVLMENPELNDSLAKFREYNRLASNIVIDPTPEPVQPIPYHQDDIILPDYTPQPERKHHAWYIDGNLNIAMLQEAADYNLPYTKSFANQLAAKSPGPFNPGQICEIFDYCYQKWRYVNDPKGQEYIARASESISSSLTGDCDDFAVLIASCLLAVGGNVTINTGNNPTGGHAFAEADITEFSDSDVQAAIRKRFNDCVISTYTVRTDRYGRRWLNLDWQANYPGGPLFDCSYGRDAYSCINGEWTWTKLN